MDANKRRRKFARLLNFIRNADIVTLQEVHGSPAEIRSLFLPLAASWLIFSAPGIDRATGGVVTLVAKTYAHSDAMIVSESIIVGRVLRSSISWGPRTNVFWNIHNHGIGAAAIRLVTARMDADVAAAAASPTTSCTWISGDWNFLASGETQLSDERPEAFWYKARSVVPSRPLSHLWTRCLDKVTEFAQPSPTHYDAARKLHQQT